MTPLRAVNGGRAPPRRQRKLVLPRRFRAGLLAAIATGDRQADSWTTLIIEHSLNTLINDFASTKERQPTRKVAT